MRISAPGFGPWRRYEHIKKAHTRFANWKSWLQRARQTQLAHRLLLCFAHTLAGWKNICRKAGDIAAREDIFDELAVLDEREVHPRSVAAAGAKRRAAGGTHCCRLIGADLQLIKDFFKAGWGLGALGCSLCGGRLQIKLCWKTD
jgi:hypothetical protein